MKVKLKTAGIVVTGITLLAIIGGETYFIINSKKDINGLTAETKELKNSLSETSSSLKAKEEQLDAIKNILNEKTADNKTDEEALTDKEEEKKETSKNKKMKEVIGEYKNNIKFSKASDGNTLYNQLELASDGTYHYTQNIYAEAGEYGNWYINENGDIILNKLFSHSSDAALRMSEKGEAKKLIINDDGSLTDANKKFEGGELDDLSKIKLNKTSSKTDFKLFETIDRYRKESYREGHDYLAVFRD